MVFTRVISVAVVLSVFLLGGTTLAAQNPSDSLNNLQTEATKQNIVLDETSKNNVQNSCQIAQNNLKSIRQKELRVQRERSETYLDVQNEIDALRLRILRQGIETNGLAQALLGYREKADQYERLSKVYAGALNETVAIDCRANPEAFMAGLMIIRLKRAELYESTQKLQDYVNTAVQEQFNLIKIDVKV